MSELTNLLDKVLNGRGDIKSSLDQVSELLGVTQIDSDQPSDTVIPPAILLTHGRTITAPQGGTVNLAISNGRLLAFASWSPAKAREIAKAINAAADAEEAGE